MAMGLGRRLDDVDDPAGTGSSARATGLVASATSPPATSAIAPHCERRSRRVGCLMVLLLFPSELPAHPTHSRRPCPAHLARDDRGFPLPAHLSNNAAAGT